MDKQSEPQTHNGLPAAKTGTSSIDAALERADVQAATSSMRYSHDEVFGEIRKVLHATG